MGAPTGDEDWCRNWLEDKMLGLSSAFAEVEKLVCCLLIGRGAGGQSGIYSRVLVDDRQRGTVLDL